MELRQLTPFVLIESDIEFCSVCEVTLENYQSKFHFSCAIELQLSCAYYQNL